MQDAFKCGLYFLLMCKLCIYVYIYIYYIVSFFHCQRRISEAHLMNKFKFQLFFLVMFSSFFLCTFLVLASLSLKRSLYWQWVYTLGPTRPNQTALSRQWLTVVIVSPILYNHTAAIIERHCGCAPSPHRGVYLVLVDGSYSRFSLPLAPTLSRVLLLPSVSPSAVSRNCLSNLASPVSLISCLVRRRDFCARRDTRPRPETRRTRSCGKIRCLAYNDEMFNR